MNTLVPAVALAAQLEPYKKLLGVLIRKDCVSLALSNPYLNLAEPLGGLMLRDGRLSARALQRMLREHQLSGFVIGCEVEGGPQPTGQQQQHDAQVTTLQEQAVQQVRSAVASISPGLPGGWYGCWSAAGASCRILPPGGPQAAAAAATPVAAAAAQSASASSSGSQQHVQASQHVAVQQQQQGGGGSLRKAAGVSGSSSSSGGGEQQQRCSLGQQFLQDYLDSLGALNTFG